MTTITTVGYGDICPNNNGERVYAIVAMVVGGAFYGYIIGNISSIVSSVDSNRRAYNERMEIIHTYMKIRKFPPELKTKVCACTSTFIG
jgi:potassium voltage-gated channel Eag-related subfamily H protein 4